MKSFRSVETSQSAHRESCLPDGDKRRPREKADLAKPLAACEGISLNLPDARWYFHFFDVCAREPAAPNHFEAVWEPNCTLAPELVKSRKCRTRVWQPHHREAASSVLPQIAPQIMRDVQDGEMSQLVEGLGFDAL